MKLNNSKNLQPGDKVIHQRGWVGEVTNVEYIPVEFNKLYEPEVGLQLNSCDEVEVNWVHYDGAGKPASRTSSHYLTKLNFE